MADGAALFLSQRTHDGYEQFSLGIQCVNVLFLKIHLDAFFLQFADGSQTVDCVAGKSANGLGKNQVDFAGEGIVDHAVEPVSVFDACTGDTLIGIDVHELPFRVVLYKRSVIVDLRIVAVLLLVFFRGNTSVGSYSFFLQQRPQVQNGHDGSRRFNFSYILCHCCHLDSAFCLAASRIS